MLLAHLSEVDPGQGKAREWELTFPLHSTGCHLCLRKITMVVNSCTGRKHKQGGGSGRPCRRGQDKGCVVGHPDTLSLQRTLTGTALTQEKGQKNSQGLPDHMVATELHSRPCKSHRCERRKRAEVQEGRFQRRGTGPKDDTEYAVKLVPQESALYLKLGLALLTQTTAYTNTQQGPRMTGSTRFLYYYIFCLSVPCFRRTQTPRGG